MNKFFCLCTIIFVFAATWTKIDNAKVLMQPHDESSMRSQPWLSKTLSCRCLLQPEEGQCRGHFRRFYFDVQNDTCEKFIYGGCGGNSNNFDTKEECTSYCG